MERWVLHCPWQQIDVHQHWKFESFTVRRLVVLVGKVADEGEAGSYVTAPQLAFLLIYTDLKFLHIFSTEYYSCCLRQTEMIGQRTCDLR